MTPDEESEFPAFVPEPAQGPVAPALPWKILVADDEEEVHAVTRLALSHFEFEGRPLQIIDVYSGAEAVSTMRAQPDIAVVFMDVVMESEHAGLEAVDAIRNRLGNSRTRIVLRTGQPGRAPEEGLVGRHEINDYSEKTGLTATRLKTLVHARLRDYCSLSVRDALTGLYSRSFLDESLQLEEARCGSTGRAFALALFDLDRLAALSTQSGASSADAVLRAFAAMLESQAGAGGIACRHVGEELALLMPVASADAALHHAESLRRKWEAGAAAHDVGELAPLTASAGVAIFPLHAHSPEALLQVAGAALKRARQKGGNRCELAVPAAP